VSFLNSLIALTIIIILTTAGNPVHAQRLAAFPLRHRDEMVMAGQERRVDLGRLEPGRPYLLDIELVNSTGDLNEALVEVLIGHGGAQAKQSISPLNRRLELAFVPRGSDPGARLIGGGGFGSTYSISLEWRVMPASRMVGVQFIPALHQNLRPPGATVNAVVVHATVSPTLDSTVKWFLAPESQVSAHYTVGKDGTIIQMVEDSARAWHAGVSELEGVKGVNDLSLGIEIVNLNDGIDPYTDAQYTSVANIIRHLREQYVIPESRIVSHEFIARPVGRKSDPKGFYFQRLFRMLR
jgi:hypothetical protein